MLEMLENNRKDDDELCDPEIVYSPELIFLGEWE